MQNEMKERTNWGDMLTLSLPAEAPKTGNTPQPEAPKTGNTPEEKK
jgi:hypothetical protein